MFLISNYLLSGCLLSHRGLLPNAKRFSWKSGVQYYALENQALMGNSQESHAKIYNWHRQTTTEQDAAPFLKYFFKQRVLKSQGSDSSYCALAFREHSSSLQKYALFGDISISSCFCSFLKHDTSRNKLITHILHTYLSAVCNVISASLILFTSTKII